MKYLFILLLFSIAFISCEQNAQEKTKNNSEIKEDKKDSTERDLSILDEEFINHPFEFGDVKIRNLKRSFNKYIKIEKQLTGNIHVKNQTDTLFTIKIKSSTFIIYKIPNQQFLESAEINDEIIKLNRNIFVGISKENFKEKFNELKNKKNIPDSVTVQGEDAEGYLIFTFKNNILNKIEFVGYVD